MPVPYTFGTATSSIPLSQLDSNFATAITIGNTAVQLGNTVTTLNNLTLANVTISSGNVTITNVSVTTANVSGTANVSTMVVIGNETIGGNSTVSGNTSVTGNVSANNATLTTSLTLSGGTANGVAYLNTSKALTTGSAITFDGTNFATTGTASATKLIPTGGSATGNGMWLPASNQIAFSTNGTEAMRVDASQNVGIGTSSPSNTLQVTGTSYTTGKTYIGNNTNFTNVGNLGWSPAFIVEDTNGQGIAAIRNTADAYGGTINLVKSRGTLASPSAVTNGDRLGQIYFGGYDSVDYSNTGASIEAIANATWTSNSCPSDLVFSTTTSGSFVATERMRIDSSGNLLVGTTTSTPAQSNVSGFKVGGGQIECNGTNTQAAFFGRSNDGQVVRFYNAGTAAGNISNTGTTTSYNGTSDYRLKENIQPMVGALVKVAQLKPCTYTWKSDGRTGQGFIAHELQEVIPDAVQGVKDEVDENGNPEYQGIDPRMIVATLTAALQELKSIIDTQASTITQLQADVATLKGKK